MNIEPNSTPAADTAMRVLVHALNNPLGIILGTVDLMLLTAPAEATHRQDLERIRAAAKRCAQLGRDLQAYAQAQKAGSAV